MIQTLKEQSYGTYKLVSFISRDAKGELYYPLGENPLGFIMYNQDGYMSAQLMVNDRSEILANYAESDKTSWHHNNIGYLAYSGRYDVDEEASIFTHYMDVGLNPDWHGTSQPRHVKFEGNRLYITNVLVEGEKLVWERVKVHNA